MNDDFGKGVSTIGNAWYEGLRSYGAYGMNEGFGKTRDLSLVVYGVIGEASHPYASVPAYGPVPRREVPCFRGHLTAAIRIAGAHSD